jgi:hypothetical protein
MAAKVARVYGMSIREASKLTPDQVRFMEEYAHKVAEDMFENDPQLLQRLQSELGAVRKDIRSQISAPDEGDGGGGGGPVGPPPSTGPKPRTPDEGTRGDRFYTD